MAVGQKRGPRLKRAEPPTVRREAGLPVATVLDGLLARVARGDREAFAAVCDQVGGAVYGVAHRIIGDPSRAEQLAADVLLEVWRSASRFSPAEGSGLEWVMTLARRRATSQVAGGEWPGRSLPSQRDLASLPGPQREALLLASAGYTWRQAAELLGVPAHTMAERIRDGLLALGNGPE